MKRLQRLRFPSSFASLVRKPVTERPQPRPLARSDARFHGSLQLRHVDVGSCNGCEVEIASALGPHYDVQRFGARLVASPRHADGLLVTGVVTHNMAGPLGQTLAALPRPHVIVACGDCAVNGGIFANAAGVASLLSEVVPVDLEIPGCPPHPLAIVQALRSLTGR
jgi:Ni,Fe-hydrogenase III small subunit